jgi:hypothetical protein
MRRLWLSLTLLLVSLSVASTAAAGPITGAPVTAASEESSAGGDGGSDDEESSSAPGGLLALGGFDSGVLFDAMGLPLLRLSAPIYLRLGLSAPAEAAAPSGGGDDLGNVGWTPPPIPLPPPPKAVPEPAALLLCLPGALLAMRRFARKPSPLRA